MSLFQFFDLTIPLATRMPCEPNSIARSTSSVVTIPAPQRSFVEFLAFFTANNDFVISSGRSLEIALPVPINSGGSIAMYVGLSLAYFSASCTFFTKMVDELVEFSEHDPDLSEGIKWLDGQAQKKGLSFYDMVFEVLYKHDVNSKAKEWLNSRN